MLRSKAFSWRCSRVLCVALLCGTPLTGEPCTPEAPDPGASASATASIEFLAREMDRCHDRFVVYEDVSSACNHFPVFGAIGNHLAALDVFGSGRNRSPAPTHDPRHPR